MRIFLKQLYRGLLALILGIMVFAFILVSISASYLTDVDAYQKLFSDEAFITQQKTVVDEAIDALAKKNRFDAAPIKEAVTQNTLTSYNLRIISWWQTAVATGVWGDAPFFDAEILRPAIDTQEKLDDRKKASTIVAVQKTICAKVVDASEEMIKKVMQSVPTARAIDMIPYAKIALIAVFAVGLALLLLSLARQFTLFLWFSGLAAFTCGGLLIAVNALLHSLNIAETIIAYSNGFGTSVSLVIGAFSGGLSFYGFSGLITGAALFISYFVVFQATRRFKQIVNA